MAVDRMHMLSVFLAVGETQGFAAAARRLGLSPAAITRAISSLERDLGVELLRRSTRNVRLTDAGKRYLADIKDILGQIAEVNDAASVSPRGTLVVAASELFGRCFVMPCIAEYLERFPDVDVVGYFFDRIINLLDEDVDVAIGIGREPDQRLLAIQVGELRHVLCAAPSYLEAHGTPREPGDLLHHTLIAVGANVPVSELKFDGGSGQVSVCVLPRLMVTSDDAAIAAAASGLGLLRAFAFQVADHLARGDLVPVLARYGHPDCPVHVLCREDNCKAPKISEFISMLVARLRCHEDLH